MDEKIGVKMDEKLRCKNGRKIRRKLFKKFVENPCFEKG